jgi:hypothetical protein
VSEAVGFGHKIKTLGGIKTPWMGQRRHLEQSGALEATMFGLEQTQWFGFSGVSDALAT